MVTASEVLLLLYAYWMVVTTHQNSTIGRDPISSFITDLPKIDTATLFLDSNNSFTCNGTMNTWRFCYFTDGRSDNDSIGVWKKIDNTSYELVDGSLLSLRGMVIELEAVDFVCVRHIVRPFNVTEGDVIGAVISSNLSAFSLVRPAEDGRLYTATPTPNFKVNINGIFLEGYAIYAEAYFEDDLLVSTTKVSTEMVAPVSDKLWVIFAVSFLSLLVLVLAFIVCVTIVMLVKSRNKYGITEKTVELSPQLRNQASTPREDPPSLQSFQHQSSTSLPSSSIEEPGPSSVQTQNSIHMFSYPPPDKRAPLPPAKTPPPGSPKNSAHHQTSSLPNLPTTPSSPHDVALHRQLSLTKPDSPLDLGPKISPDASNGVAPLHSSSLPAGVGQAFMNDGVFEDVSQSMHAVRKNPYAKVKKTGVGRLQSAPLTADPEYAEPIVVKRGRLYSEQPGSRVPRSHKPRPPLTKTVGFEVPTKISAATIIKNSLMHSSTEKQTAVDSLSLEKIVEADENEALPAADSRQAAPEMYLEPVKTTKSKK